MNKSIPYDVNVQVAESEFTVQETDLDVFGHVNNSAYLRLFENARWDIISAAGIDLNHILKTEVGPVILEVDIKFLKEIRAREKIRIRSQVIEYQGRVGMMEQKISGSGGEVRAQAKFKFGIFDLKLRKLIAPPDEWMRALGIKRQV